MMCDRCKRPVPNPISVCISKYQEIDRPYRCWDCEDMAPYGNLHFYCLDTTSATGDVCTADPPAWRPLADVPR